MLNKFIKLLFLIPILVFTIFLQHLNAQVVVFDHSINSSYFINNDESASASYTINTTNRINNNYLKQFSLDFPFEPHHISVSNNIRVKNVEKRSETNIFRVEFEFLNPEFGSGKSFQWSFTFQINKLLVNHGMQKSVIIPTFSSDNMISTNNISVNVPKNFGNVEYVYGNYDLISDESNYMFSFVDSKNNNSNIIILLGDKQQYSFEYNSNESINNSIILPVENTYQSVYYTNFPKNIINNNSDIQNSFILEPQAKIAGIIDTNTNKDFDKGNSRLKNSDLETFQNNLNILELINLSSKEKAEKIFTQIIPNFNIDQYVLSDSLNINLSNDKVVVNIAEINEIYQILLGKVGIETRGVYGYVFPIQPFERNEYFVEPHIWTEFWDGNEWISVDPSWIISSNGTNYFEKNRFHHIKFGEYFEFQEVFPFIYSDRFFEITPLSKRIFHSYKENLEIEVDKFVYLNKELKFSLTNNSDQIIYLNNVDAKISDSSVKFESFKFKDNQVIYPGQTIDTVLKLNYGFLPLNKHFDLKFDINYKSGTEIYNFTKQNQTYVHSNISTYLTYFLIIGFIIIMLISVLLMSVYKIN